MKMHFDESMSMENILKWRRVIHMSATALTDRQKSFIPDIYVYTTLTKSIAETFNIDHPGCDKICQKLFKEGTWAFAFLQTESLRNKKIKKSNFKRAVISSSRHELTPDMSPEVVVIHEFMHFWVFDGLNIPFSLNNEEAVEDMCNRYALASYMSLIVHHPQYSTHSADSTLIGIENAIRKELEEHNYTADNKIKESIIEKFLNLSWGENNDCIRNR